MVVHTRTYVIVSVPIQIIADNSSGLLFKNKRDRKMICVDPKVSTNDIVEGSRPV